MHHNLCKNCTHTFDGNFCSNCGQKTNTKRLDWHYIYDELKYTFLHINNGLLYTSKQLFVRPGFMVKEFLEGKRVKHYKPILMVFVLAGITGFLMHYIQVENYIPNYNSKDENYIANVKKITSWIKNHYSIVELALIPLVSICSWISFRKWGYNFIENVIISSFASSQRLIIRILIFPINYYIEDICSYTFKTLFSLSAYILTIWLYFQLYNVHKTIHIIGRLMLMFLYLIIGFLVLCVGIGFGYAFLNAKQA